MKQIIIIFILSLLLSQGLSGVSQTNFDNDSLFRKLDKTHIISDKIDLYLLLSNQFKKLDLDKAVELANNALILAKKTNSISKLGIIYFYLGEYSLLHDNTEDAEKMFKIAEKHLKTINKPEDLITVYLSIGNRYVEKDNYAEAMKYYLMAIDLSEENDYKNKLPNLFNNLGIVYLNINKLEKAINLYSKALILFEEEKDSMNVAGTITNIGSIYLQMGQYDIAETYYFNGYKLFKEANNLEGMAHSQLKLGLLDMFIHKYDSAINHLSNSLNIQKKLEVTYSGSKSVFIAETYINLGISYLHLSNNKAKDFLLKGNNIAVKTKQYSLIALSAEFISKYYQNKGELELSLEYFQMFKQYSDSIYNEESIRKITQVEMQYQFNTKLKENELARKIKDHNQKRKNLIYIIISGSLFFFLVIVVLLLRLEKSRKRKAELEKKTLANKLEHTNKELTTYVMYLLRKNEFIISIAEKLKIAKLDAKAENKKNLNDLIKELESNSTMVSWEEFEIRFQQVYTGFYKNLNINFPDITPNELRLCAFFRLNMTTKEIAAITYQSTNSIVVARYRLRKKLGLDKDENLVSFLSKI